MTLSDVVIILMMAMFLPFNEGIIAKSPRWKSLADAIDIGVVRAFNWRANADITTELEVLVKYFKWASIVSGGLLVVGVLLKVAALLFMLSAAFFVCFFAWFSFEWTFKHVQAVKSFAPMVGYSLAGPWLLLLLDHLSPEAGLMKVLAQQLAHLPIQLTSPVQIAGAISLMFLVFFGIYYVFSWLVFSPFAYLVLVGLKLSRTVSRFLVSRFNRNLLNDLSIFVQFGGAIFLYLSGRPG